MQKKTTKILYRIDLSKKNPDQVVEHLEAVFALRNFLFANNISHNFSVKKNGKKIVNT